MAVELWVRVCSQNKLDLSPPSLKSPSLLNPSHVFILGIYVNNKIETKNSVGIEKGKFQAKSGFYECVTRVDDSQQDGSVELPTRVFCSLHFHALLQELQVFHLHLITVMGKGITRKSKGRTSKPSGPSCLLDLNQLLLAVRQQC